MCLLQYQRTVFGHKLHSSSLYKSGHLELDGVWLHINSLDIFIIESFTNWLEAWCRSFERFIEWRIKAHSTPTNYYSVRLFASNYALICMDICFFRNIINFQAQFSVCRFQIAKEYVFAETAAWNASHCDIENINFVDGMACKLVTKIWISSWVLTLIWYDSGRNVKNISNDI